MNLHPSLTEPRRGRPIGRRALLRGASAGALVLLAGGVTALGGRGRPRLFSAARGMMGTQATLLLAHPDAERAAELAEAAFARMEAAARAMTRFDPASEVGRVNAAPGQWVPIGPLTAEVTEAALALARASDGAFDPGLDRLSTLWGFHDHRPPEHLPARRDLAPWLGHAAYRALALERRAGGAWLRIADPQVGLDLGGIAKGYAIDQAVALLRERGVRHALIEAGGDLYALGTHPDGSPWPIGVRHARDPGRLQAVIGAADEAIATSGDYENFFERGGRRFAHLIDPRAARPARSLRSLTVRGKSALLADGLATAAFVAPHGTFRGLLGRLGEAGWLAVDRDGRELRG